MVPAVTPVKDKSSQVFSLISSPICRCAPALNALILRSALVHPELQLHGSPQLSCMCSLMVSCIQRHAELQVLDHAMIVYTGRPVMCVE